MIAKTNENEPSMLELEARWNEVRLCAELLKSGQARIVTKRDKNGKEVRYTELIKKRARQND